MWLTFITIMKNNFSLEHVGGRERRKSLMVSKRKKVISVMHISGNFINKVY